MAKIQVNETQLKNLIKESVEKILNEQGEFSTATPDWTQQANPNSNIRVPMATQQQLDARAADRAREVYQQNNEANASLDRWNKLGTIGQIKAIQQLVGAEQDGKLGPQTLGKIFMALGKRQQITTPAGVIYPDAMKNVKWGYGKQGTYTNRQ